MNPNLSATSALVLLWSGRDLYDSAATKAYWNKLNLAAGSSLLQACNQIWSHYAQVIINRKWQILRWSRELLAEGKIGQVVIVGAGYAPLGIELAAQFPKVTVFELDRDGMAEKANLCLGLPGLGGRLKFIQADVTDSATCRDLLKNNDWDAHAPTLVIMEGISYYISLAATQALWRLFATGEGASRCIFEYLVPEEDVVAKRRHIPTRVFGEIAKRCRLSLIHI